MGTPKGNGLVEIVDEKSSDKGFFCMKLVGFITEEMNRSGDKSFDFWHQRFLEAQGGRCAYTHICPNYARTVAKRGKKPVQLNIDFKFD